MRLRHIATVVLGAMLLSGAVSAQDSAPLILDNSNSGQITVTRKGKQALQDKTQDKVAAQPTPNPADVLVGIVNNRILTREEIDARVADRYEELKKEVAAKGTGVVTVMGPQEIRPLLRPEEQVGKDQFTPEGNLSINASPEEIEAELVEGQDQILEQAKRTAEAEVLQEWVEHSMLADEARRQGMVVGEKEFRARLADAEKESNLNAKEIDWYLDKMRMTRADYERSVYDALMIEKLLNHFIVLNFDDAYFRDRYNAHPELFYEPEKSLLAHFVITLSGRESREELRTLREKAKQVQDRLKAGEDPKKIFAEPAFNQIDAGIVGSVPGWFTFQEGFLPPLVETAARKLKTGETSDVLVQQMKGDNGGVVPSSIHVVKILDRMPPTGDTFETALPAMHRAMIEVARMSVLDMVRKAGTHRVITNLGGIPARLIPTPEVMRQQQANAQPINLKLPPQESTVQKM